ncbi:hypothetical protein PR002_g14172 [Phytophthora rubi]|uniref:Uncharacterized protein n=1 Tax=Phytophthora rubi TaxID=129364 RepID=A0A6A3L4R6_9STRA|nr:hypothetical protein PR002_g14172 [Phytophthora rubi]
MSTTTRNLWPRSTRTGNPNRSRSRSNYPSLTRPFTEWLLRMEATPLVLPLPLHPRRAQQLFQEVLLTDAELLSEQSLPQRLQQLQRLNLSGIQEAKRGARFQRIQAAADSSPHNEGEQVTLKLSKDGSTLQMLSDADGTVTASLQLVDVQGITLHATPIHSFSLKLSQHDDEPDNNATTVGATNTLVASSEGDLNRPGVAGRATSHLRAGGSNAAA